MIRRIGLPLQLSRVVASFLFGAVLLSCGVAQAQDFASASKHFQAGSEAFGRGQYKKARTEFLAAFEITKDPLLQFNIGLAEEKLGDKKAAVTAYRAYLAGTPDAGDKATVEQHIAELSGGQPAPGVPVGDAAMLPRLAGKWRCEGRATEPTAGAASHPANASVVGTVDTRSGVLELKYTESKTRDNASPTELVASLSWDEENKHFRRSEVHKDGAMAVFVGERPGPDKLSFAGKRTLDGKTADVRQSIEILGEREFGVLVEQQDGSDWRHTLETQCKRGGGGGGGGGGGEKKATDSEKKSGDGEKKATEADKKTDGGKKTPDGIKKPAEGGGKKAASDGDKKAGKAGGGAGSDAKSSGGK